MSESLDKQVERQDRFAEWFANRYPVIDGIILMQRGRYAVSPELAAEIQEYCEEAWNAALAALPASPKEAAGANTECDEGCGLCGGTGIFEEGRCPQILGLGIGEAAGVSEEPVAWMVERDSHDAPEVFTNEEDARVNSILGLASTYIVPLYRHPATKASKQ
jgi:hypothetical protein